MLVSVHALMHLCTPTHLMSTRKCGRMFALMDFTHTLRRFMIGFHWRCWNPWFQKDMLAAPVLRAGVGHHLALEGPLANSATCRARLGPVRRYASRPPPRPARLRARTAQEYKQYPEYQRLHNGTMELQERSTRLGYSPSFSSEALLLSRAPSPLSFGQVATLQSLLPAPFEAIRMIYLMSSQFWCQGLPKRDSREGCHTKGQAH